MAVHYCVVFFRYDKVPYYCSTLLLLLATYYRTVGTLHCVSLCVLVAVRIAGLFPHAYRVE